MKLKNSIIKHLLFHMFGILEILKGQGIVFTGSCYSFHGISTPWRRCSFESSLLFAFHTSLLPSMFISYCGIIDNYKLMKKHAITKRKASCQKIINSNNRNSKTLIWEFVSQLPLGSKNIN